jgi:CBS domain-containing protein
VAQAARTMLEYKIGCLPVVEDGRLVGLVTETDLLRQLVGS